MSRPEWDRASRFASALNKKFCDLPILQCLPVKTPAGHPDLRDSDEGFDTEMNELARLSRYSRIGLQNGGRCSTEADELRIYNEMFATAAGRLPNESDMFPTDIEFHIDLAEFGLIADDIHGIAS